MVIFLFGPDSFRSRRKLGELTAKFKRDIDPTGLNLTEIDGESTSIDAIQGAIGTTPFLAMKRMVVIKRFVASQPKAKQDEFFEYLKNRDHSEVIIVFWDELAKESKTNLFGFLAKQPYSQRFDLLDDHKIKAWVAAECQTQAISIEPAAIAVLVDYCGNNLWLITNELAKLWAYCSGETITAEMVLAITTSRLEEDVFALTDALGQKQKAKTVSLLEQQFQNNISPQELLSAIAWHVRSQLLLTNARDANPRANALELAKITRLHPFVVKKNLPRLQYFNQAQLASLYQRLRNIDHKLKTSQINAALLFDLFVVSS